MYQSAVPFARQLGLDGLPMGTYNGGAIWDFPSGRMLFHEPLDLATCKKVAAFCEARSLHLNAYVDDELYVPDMGEKTRDYVSVAGVQAHPVGSLFLWVAKPSTKMLIVDEPARIQELRGEIIDLLGPSFNVTSSIPRFLEITSERATKGIALASMAESLGVPQEQVMAVGDAFNDLSMLKWAGTSFALPHAPEEVKRASTYVTEAGAGLGVAEALERMGLA